MIIILSDREAAMRKAFTLIEMLVVIAIIAILAGLLMPALTRARKEARKTHCMNNEHNVGIYLAMYKTDNRGRYPSVSFPGTGAGRRYDSSLSIARLWPDYADNLELFHCLMTNHEVFITPDEVDGDPINLDNNSDTVEYRFETEITETNDPDYMIDPNVPMNARSGRAVYADAPDLDALRTVSGLGSSFPAKNYANHEYGAVVLFFDGHTSFVMHDDDGKTPNMDLLGQVDVGGGTIVNNVRQDSDIYRDDNWDGGTNWDDDEVYDCNLGNFVDRSDNAKDDDWYSGPDLDWDTVD